MRGKCEQMMIERRGQRVGQCVEQWRLIERLELHNCTGQRQLLVAVDAVSGAIGLALRRFAMQCTLDCMSLEAVLGRPSSLRD